MQLNGILVLALCGAIAHSAGCSHSDAIPLAEGAAAETLLARLIADELYPWAQGGSCITLVVERSHTDMFEIAVRERHEPPCVGDAGTGPVVDRFRVDRISGAILRYDAVAAEYRRYEGAEGS